MDKDGPKSKQITNSASDRSEVADALAALLARAEEVYIDIGEAKTPQEAIMLCTNALELFRQAQAAVNTDPTLAQQAEMGLAKVYSQRGHQQRYAANHLEAIKDLTHALTLNSTLADDYYYRALSYMKIGNQAAARRDFSEYIKRGDDEYLQQVAWQRRESLMPQKAEALAKLEHWRNQGTHFNGEASNKLHPSGEAVPDYAGAIALYNQAITAFDKALELATDDKLAKIYKLAALKGQAQCYSQIAEYDLAIADYNQVIQMQPNPQHIFERGETYRIAGQPELARADFEQFLKNGTHPASRQLAQNYLTEKPTKLVSPNAEAHK